MPIAHHEKRVYKNRGVVITLAQSYETLEWESLEAVEPLWLTLKNGVFVAE